MFASASDFNQLASARHCFLDASRRKLGSRRQSSKRLRRPIGNWSTGAVEDMERMFHGATAFNQLASARQCFLDAIRREFARRPSRQRLRRPVGRWNTSKGKTLYYTCCIASSFDQPLGRWDTSNVEDMFGTFFMASSFDQFAPALARIPRRPSTRGRCA